MVLVSYVMLYFDGVNLVIFASLVQIVQIYIFYFFTFRLCKYIFLSIYIYIFFFLIHNVTFLKKILHLFEYKNNFVYICCFCDGGDRVTSMATIKLLELSMYISKGTSLFYYSMNFS